MVLGGFRSFHVLALTRQLDHFFLLQTIYYACIFGGDGHPYKKRSQV